jgi:hypothetical protein
VGKRKGRKMKKKKLRRGMMGGSKSEKYVEGNEKK